MTVAELIEQLKELPQDLEVVERLSNNGRLMPVVGVDIIDDQDEGEERNPERGRVAIVYW